MWQVRPRRCLSYACRICASALRFSLLKEYPLYIVPCNDEHEEHEEDDSYEMDHAFFLFVDWFSAYCFEKEEHEASAV